MEVLEDKILPLILCGTAVVTALVGLMKEIKSNKSVIAAEKKEENGLGEEPGEAWLPNLIAGAWITGFFLGILFVGFKVAIPAFVVAYMKWRRMSWLSAITYAFVTLGSLYAIFELGLDIQLYRGVFGS